MLTSLSKNCSNSSDLMPDARRNTNPNKIRIAISGGLDDIRDLESLIKGDRLTNGWELNWYQLKQRGDHGPLHDLQLGFIEPLN
jgi:hypothetical protein